MYIFSNIFFNVFPLFRCLALIIWTPFTYGNNYNNLVEFCPVLLEKMKMWKVEDNNDRKLTNYELKKPLKTTSHNQHTYRKYYFVLQKTYNWYSFFKFFIINILIWPQNNASIWWIIYHFKMQGRVNLKQFTDKLVALGHLLTI